jgi:ADP-heptose:LPS heptosyltransferase
VLQEPLDRVAAVLARCTLAVGVDTGLLHLAAAVGTRYVGLFGPTNPRVTGPYVPGTGSAAERSAARQHAGETLVAPFAKTAACRGCWRQFKYIDDRCAALGTPSCMAHLQPGEVIAAALRQLGAACPPAAAPPTAEPLLSAPA